MFTGLIETTGTLLAAKTTDGGTRLIIAAPQLAGRWKIGDSIDVNGVCLTALDMEDANEPHPGRFAADLAQETIEAQPRAPATWRSTQPRAPTPAGSPLGGHVVQGHVDATGKLLSLVPLRPGIDTSDWRMTVELPPQLAAQVISQGSITLDGISLTIAKLHPPSEAGSIRIEIAILPHTYRSTNLHSKMAGDPVNIETDALSKYAALQLAAAANATTPTSLERLETASGSSHTLPHDWLTTDYLLANGY